MALPPGWVIEEVIEELPTLNPPPMTGPFFTRRTFICSDADGNYICSSGSEDDCNTQALTAAQSRTQQQPYDQAI